MEYLKNSVFLFLLALGLLVSCQKRSSDNSAPEMKGNPASQQTSKPVTGGIEKEKQMDPSWHVYMTDIDGERASITVDTSAQVEGPQRFHHVIVLGLEAKNLKDNGFPSDEDFDTALSLEERIEKEFGPTDIRSVGRVTTKGIFRLYFYCVEPNNNTDRIAELAKATGRHVTVEHRDDKNWNVYKERLYPSPDDWQQIKDLQVLSALRKSGDDWSKRRQVDHWLYFRTADARDAVAGRLLAKGFRIIGRKDPEKSEDKWVLHVQREDSVRPQDITKITVSLMHLAKEHGGEYDGWETSVEK
jgi:uncharacterized protein (TIGR01619 family)